MRAVHSARPAAAALAVAALVAALPLVTAALVAGPLTGTSARADAPIASAAVQLADPLMTDPVQVLVTGVDAGGDAVPFSGVVTLTTGRTSVSALATADASGAATVDLPTDALSGGWGTVRAVVQSGGRTVIATATRAVQVPVSLAIGGFGCTALTAAGGQVRFAVTTMNGVTIADPASVEYYELPYVTVTAGPVKMVGADGMPLPTTGRMTISVGGRTVGAVTLPKAVRPLVFGVRWAARIRGRFSPGTATATLVLVDPHGRTTSAVQPVHLVRTGTAPCA